ncbi:MAG: hypothetical protein EZS28_009306 [Streblomastix strix]|uniref:Uncharacterized protein n=1 Tax=Streblomastix strix TaxID=222440 RepID=A0A5J4WK04_9EUKA|nr:MAG: hypothetical protein EZS28_009306 [Streblomastix strix]
MDYNVFCICYYTSVSVRPVVPVDQSPPPFVRPTTTILIKEHEKSMKTEDDAERVKEAQEIGQLHQEMRVAERALDPDSCCVLELCGQTLTQIDPIASRSHLVGLLSRLVQLLTNGTQ